VASLPLLASCGAGTPPVAKVASIPTTLSTPSATPAPTAGPAIGDTCTVGTWRISSARLVFSMETAQGIVSIPVVGGTGELDHYFIDGTVVENLAGTPFTGSAHGYRVTLRAIGTLRSPVVFTEGRETVEPIDTSAARLTYSINGSAPKPFLLATYEELNYTCGGNALTESDTTGDVYTYRRLSSTP
jgi:hypothetical protein